ncbi:MAG TPA: hypothetical protein VLB83_02845 [Candidatus Paceibacterota bacterium]|nr:hypothetical protein [Candidatus Paceibacterota bacterium]
MAIGIYLVAYALFSVTCSGDACWNKLWLLQPALILSESLPIDAISNDLRENQVVIPALLLFNSVFIYIVVYIAGKIFGRMRRVFAGP